MARSTQIRQPISGVRLLHRQGRELLLVVLGMGLAGGGLWLGGGTGGGGRGLVLGRRTGGDGHGLVIGRTGGDGHGLVLGRTGKGGGNLGSHRQLRKKNGKI